MNRDWVQYKPQSSDKAEKLVHAILHGLVEHDLLNNKYRITDKGISVWATEIGLKK